MIVRYRAGWLNLLAFSQFIDDREYDRILLYAPGQSDPVPVVGEDAKRVRTALEALVNIGAIQEVTA